MSKKLIQATQALAAPLAEQLGYQFIDVEYKRESVGMVLTVYIDKPGGVSMEDCQTLAQELDPLLDAMEDMPEGYFFSVSSPGLDRPLKKEGDYARNVGKTIVVRLYAPLEGKKQFQGILVAYDAETLCLDCEGQRVELARKAVASAKPHITF